MNEGPGYKLSKEELNEEIASVLNHIDYSVQFANIQRVINNIPEPWKTELAETTSDLQLAIQGDLAIIKVCLEQIQRGKDEINR